MSRLSLPAGADAGFRLELWNAFGDRFTANVYGRDRSGWFLARYEYQGDVQSVGPQPLGRGQWREFLGLIKQAGFWELPERISPDPNVVTEDGAWLTLMGRHGDRYHEINRDEGDNRALSHVTRFLLRLSGFFPEPPHLPGG
jgi:hypothetical protein